MSYHQMYRRTTLGNTLQEALDEMISHNLIQPKVAAKIFGKFDQCISDALAKRVKTRLNLRGHLKTYRCCDNVWTLVMIGAEIKDSSSIIQVDKMKIVACESKSLRQANSSVSAKQAPSNTAGSSASANPITEGNVMDDDIEKFSDEDPV